MGVFSLFRKFHSNPTKAPLWWHTCGCCCNEECSVHLALFCVWYTLCLGLMMLLGRRRRRNVLKGWWRIVLKGWWRIWGEVEIVVDINNWLPYFGLFFFLFISFFFILIWWGFDDMYDAFLLCRFLPFWRFLFGLSLLLVLPFPLVFPATSLPSIILTPFFFFPLPLPSFLPSFLNFHCLELSAGTGRERWRVCFDGWVDGWVDDD